MDKFDYRKVSEEGEKPREFEATMPKELQNILEERKFRFTDAATGGPSRFGKDYTEEDEEEEEGVIISILSRIKRLTG